jgi:hypothetical protein
MRETKEEQEVLALRDTLRTLAPSVCFQLQRSPDEDTRWDGTGPDPIENGYRPYDVDVIAITIIQGQIVRGDSSLGGSYYQEDEPLGLVHGYLYQMLDVAAEKLSESVPQGHPIHDQIAAVRAYLREVMQRNYDQQRQELNSAHA